jgi:hypothetical protein
MGFVDRVCPVPTLHPQTLVSLRRSWRQGAQQGTPVRFRDGPAAVTGQDDRCHRCHCVSPPPCDAGGGREKATTSARESEDLPIVPGAREGCEGGPTGTSRTRGAVSEGVGGISQAAAQRVVACASVSPPAGCRAGIVVGRVGPGTARGGFS